MIRSSSHILKFTNPGKLDSISLFLDEYRRVASLILDDLWENGLQTEKVDFSIQQKKLFLPQMLPSEYLKRFDSWFTARMKQCVGKQVCSMLRASIKKRQKQLWMLRNLQQDGKDTKYLQRKIDTQPLAKPTTENIKAELDSRFVDFQPGKYFDLFLKIKQIGNGLSFNLPVKHTKISRKWQKRGVLKKSIRLSENRLVIFFEIEKAPVCGGRVVGADQGMLSCLSLDEMLLFDGRAELL
jgi:hypothetical protein